MPDFAVTYKFLAIPKCDELNAGFLEIVDLNENTVSYVQVPQSKYQPAYPSWFRTISETNFILSNNGQDGIVTVDSSGYVRLWETSNVSVLSIFTSRFIFFPVW